MGIGGRIRAQLPEAHAVDGPLRPVASVVHRLAVAAELGLVRGLDAVVSKGADDDGLVAMATALIKTFERPQILRRLLASIDRTYPDLAVVVVDDGRQPVRIPGVQTVVLPYDTGISAGRNEGLTKVATPYVVVLDDDLVFFHRTRIDHALSVLERHPEIDILGGQVIDLPLARHRPPPRGAIFATAAEPVRPLGSTIGGLEVVDKVPNFFVARRERLGLVRWDPGLKRMEHADFFTRALGVLTTAFDPTLQCLHARTPFDAKYMSKRLDLDEASRILRDRYGD